MSSLHLWNMDPITLQRKKVKQKQNEEYDLVCYILFGIIDEHKQTHV